MKKREKKPKVLSLSRETVAWLAEVPGGRVSNLPACPVTSNCGTCPSDVIDC